MNARIFVKRAAVGSTFFALLVACGGQLGQFGQTGSTGAVLGDIACPELRSGNAMNANFDDNARANATIRAFVTASGDLAAVAAAAEAEVGQACERIARDLGVAPDQMAPRGNESRVASTCRAASARMDAILQQGAQARIQARVTPPACQVQSNVEAQCKAQCSGNVDPGYVKANCQPGKLYGRCDGTCTGKCDGNCNGECQGACNAQSVAGRCAGQCQGTCKGACSADCHGGCNVDFKEPKCDVAMKGPSADARCDGSCKAHADLRAQCTPARVDVQAAAETGDLGKLVATLRANLPALVHAEIAYGKRIAGDIETLVETGAELPRAFGQLSSHAGACLGAAANACLSAQASIRVSVQASASISAKAGASSQ